MMVAVNDGTGLQYLLTDHLGSTVAVTNQSGTLTSQQRYLPFGAARTIPNSPILGTDFTYTGQRKLDDGMGGVMDYKARSYSVGLGRFLQADSIIPDPVNPQSFNRFSYVLNRPIFYRDPSGHTYMCDESCEENLGRRQYTVDDMAELYGISFNPGWSVTNRAIAMLAVYNIAKKLQNERNSAADSAYQSCLENMSGPTSTCSQSAPISTSDAFKESYHYGIDFVWGCSGCERLGITSGKKEHTIMFRDFYQTGDTQLKNTNLVIHELGHMFNNLNTWVSDRSGRAYGPAWSLTTDLAANRDGFGTQWVYQHSDDISQSEIFADMFVHWIQGGWATDSISSQTAANARIDWLNQYMPGYLP
ncbi:MAG: hypothetical protein IPM31_07870 [Anaerolineae bacterium]|nr:hypothetical protein [Anaerolineae bacterium]MBL8104628.1 hypothetical protein [Anaerolineales bacterium]